MEDNLLSNIEEIRTAIKMKKMNRWRKCLKMQLIEILGKEGE